MEVLDPVCQPPEGENKRITRSMRGISKLKVPYVGTVSMVNSKPKSSSKVAGKASSRIACVVSSSEPQTVNQALSLPHWKNAMKEEICALKRNHTWQLVPYDSNLRIVDCKWVFKINLRLMVR